MKLTKLRQSIKSCTKLSPEEKESILLEIETLEAHSDKLWLFKDHAYPLNCFLLFDVRDVTHIPRAYWYLLDSILTNSEDLPYLDKYHTMDIS